MSADIEAQIREITKNMMITSDMTNSQIVDAVGKNIRLIKQLDPNSEVIKLVVQKYPHSVAMMETEYEHLWILAISSSSSVIHQCKNPTEAMYLAYARSKFSSFVLVPAKWKTKAVCMEYIKQDAKSVKHIPYALKYDYDIIRAAYLKDVNSISDFPTPALTENICIEFVKTHPGSFYLLPVQHDLVCRLAVKLMPANISYVWNQTPELKALAISRDDQFISLAMIRDQDDETVNTIIRKSAQEFSNVRKQTKEMCIEMFQKNKSVARYFDPLLFPEPPRKISMQEIVAAASTLTDDDKLELMRSIFGS